MAGSAGAGSVAGTSLERLSSGQGCESGEALTEWRSCELVESDTPSTSPSYWDTDDSDFDGGLKPSDLYGKFTWKIEKFSTINKRELKSRAFEIGWSHFSQFTIAVVNKDPKKSKYSDTLHRFWKKEHDWGWKKFMELSKVSDGFLDEDTLIIKAQVQIIRERRDRPFRSLDCQYRRELVRVYLSNVEQICRRFVDDKRGKLETLLEDKARWSSFCTFWLGIHQSARRLLSSEKMELILKMIVKHFFIEKDVTSTLVIDSLFSGFKALKGQSTRVLGKAKASEGEDIPAPVVRVKEEIFVLEEDVLLLLKRATMEPLPPKDEKGPQNRTKDGGVGEEFSKDSVELDERRLTELGRRTVEIFVLTHIFSSKIEVAYQEAISLKRQEALIREEKVEGEQRVKRELAEKEKRLKKKQSKQKRNNRKAKDKAKDEKPSLVLEDEHIHENLAEKVESVGGQTILDKDGTPEDVSDVSDSVECSADILQLDSEDIDASPVNWDTDRSEVHLRVEASSSTAGTVMSSLQLKGDKRSSSVMDDSSSTCSTDSTPSLVINEAYRGNSSTRNTSKSSPVRGKSQRAKATYQKAKGSKEADSLISELVKDLRHQHYTYSDEEAESIESEATVPSLQEPMKQPEQSIKKVEVIIALQRKQINKTQTEGVKQPKGKALAASKLPLSHPRNTISAVKPKSEPKDIPVDLTAARKIIANTIQQTDKATSVINVAQASSTSTLSSINAPAPKPTEKPSGKQASFSISRPLSTPLIPVSKPAVSSVIPMGQIAQKSPVLPRSVSAMGRLGPGSSPANHTYAFQSYKNAILGNVVGPSSSSFSQPLSPSSSVNMSPSPLPSPSPSFSQSSLVPGPIYVPRAAERSVLNSVNSGISYSAAARLQSGRQQWLDTPQREAGSRSIPLEPPMFNDIRNPEHDYRLINAGSHDDRLYIPVSTSGRHTTQGGLLADEFPHLDIINDLLDDEQGLGGELNFPNHRFSLPTGVSMSVGLGSPTGSCRFERNRVYHEDIFQPEYSLPVNGHGTQPEYTPHGNIMPYMNGQIDELPHNQWSVSGYDQLSMLSMGNSGTGGWYPYGLPEYSDLACGLNGYAMFRPSNGH